MLLDGVQQGSHVEAPQRHHGHPGAQGHEHEQAAEGVEVRRHSSDHIVGLDKLVPATELPGGTADFKNFNSVPLILTYPSWRAASRLSCVIMTPFGMPVEPLEGKIKATADPP